VVAFSIFRDGKGKFKFTIVMYYQDNGQRSYKPQTKHADRLILPSSSQKYLRTYCTLEYAGAEKRTTKKVRFRQLLSSLFLFFFLIQTLDQHSLQTKAVIELL